MGSMPMRLFLSLAEVEGDEHCCPKHAAAANSCVCLADYAEAHAETGLEQATSTYSQVTMPALQCHFLDGVSMIYHPTHLVPPYPLSPVDVPVAPALPSKPMQSVFKFNHTAISSQTWGAIKNEASAAAQLLSNKQAHQATKGDCLWCYLSAQHKRLANEVERLSKVKYMAEQKLNGLQVSVNTVRAEASQCEHLLIQAQLDRERLEQCVIQNYVS